jgi:heme/copper-type cytochrome/quinol oxidase subunit 3
MTNDQLFRLMLLLFIVGLALFFTGLHWIYQRTRAEKMTDLAQRRSVVKVDIVVMIGFLLVLASAVMARCWLERVL